MMAKGKKQKRNQQKTGSKIARATVPVKNLRFYDTIPQEVQTVHRFRRSITRQLSWTPTVGLDGYPYRSLQISFSPGGTNYRIGGTSIYTDPVPNSSEFTNLYDNYRLIQVYFRMDMTGASSSPLAIYAPDYNDVADADSSALRQYPQARVHHFLKDGYTPLVFGFEPLPLKDVAGSGVSTGYSPDMTRPFLRTAEFSIPYYGMKFYFDANGGSSSVVTNFIQITVWLEFECTGVI